MNPLVIKLAALALAGIALGMTVLADKKKAKPKKQDDGKAPLPKPKPLTKPKEETKEEIPDETKEEEKTE